MSDQAILWKFAFGILVLLFCGAAWLVRRDAPPPSAADAGVRLEAAPSVIPLPAASAPPLLQRDPAPADIPDAQETPVRIRISLAEAPRERRTALKSHRHLRPISTAKVHRHPHVKHAKAQRPRYVSPYAIGRKHYPLDSREG
jgi:hypothetical protein